MTGKSNQEDILKNLDDLIKDIQSRNGKRFGFSTLVKEVFSDKEVEAYKKSKHRYSANRNEESSDYERLKKLYEMACEKYYGYLPPFPEIDFKQPEDWNVKQYKTIKAAIKDFSKAFDDDIKKRREK